MGHAKERLLELVQEHVPESCLYVSYFQNSDGDKWLFWLAEGDTTAQIWCTDLDPKKTYRFDKRGALRGVIARSAEQMWMYACATEIQDLLRYRARRES